MEAVRNLQEETIEVVMQFGDDFCDSNSIAEIDFLKIDTEGYDLGVLVGFAKFIREKRVFLIEVEVTTNLDNRFHVHLERFIHWLHPFGYHLLSVGDYDRKIHATNQDLNSAWYCNALFVRERERVKLRRDGKN